MSAASGAKAASSKKVAAAATALPPSTNLRTGIVEGVSGSTCTVNISGSVLQLPFLSSYIPLVGDNVNVLRTQNTWLVIGQSAPQLSFCRVRQTAAQSLGNGAAVPISFNVLDTPDFGMWDGATQIIARRSAWYAVGGNISFAANATGIRTTATAINGASSLGGGTDMLVTSTGASARLAITSTILFLNAGDALTLLGFQNSGGALNTAVSGSEQSTLSMYPIS